MKFYSLTNKMNTIYFLHKLFFSEIKSENSWHTISLLKIKMNTKLKWPGWNFLIPKKINSISLILKINKPPLYLAPKQLSLLKNINFLKNLSILKSLMPLLNFFKKIKKQLKKIKNFYKIIFNILNNFLTLINLSLTIIQRTTLLKIIQLQTEKKLKLKSNNIYFKSNYNLLFL
jgi:hypothetical protein